MPNGGLTANDLQQIREESPVQSPSSSPRTQPVKIVTGRLPVFSPDQMTAAQAEQQRSMIVYSMMVCILLTFTCIPMFSLTPGTAELQARVWSLNLLISVIHGVLHSCSTSACQRRFESCLVVVRQRHQLCDLAHKARACESDHSCMNAWCCIHECAISC